jgi:hypothetical protein
MIKFSSVQGSVFSSSVSGMGSRWGECAAHVCTLFSSTANLRESYGSQVYQEMQLSREETWVGPSVTALWIFSQERRCFQATHAFQNRTGYKKVPEKRWFLPQRSYQRWDLEFREAFVMKKFRQKFTKFWARGGLFFFEKQSNIEHFFSSLKKNWKE